MKTIFRHHNDMNIYELITLNTSTQEVETVRKTHAYNINAKAYNWGNLELNTCCP